MTAVHTNVLVRLLTEDDREQAAAARALFAAGPIWIAKTVLLETAWVLRRLYGFEQEPIRQVFVNLLGLQNVHVEDAEVVASALALAAGGIAFTDAIHLSSRPARAVFATFDQALVRRGKRAGVLGLRLM